MPFPKTADEAEAQGYRFDRPAFCGGCGASVLWFRTPKKKFIPIDGSNDGQFVPHWATCPKADDFRRKR